MGAIGYSFAAAILIMSYYVRYMGLALDRISILMSCRLRRATSPRLRAVKLAASPRWITP
jgi:hypothetical protein